MNVNMQDIALKAIEWDKATTEMFDAMVAKGKSKWTPEYEAASVAFSDAKQNMKEKKRELVACIKSYGAL